MSIALKYPKSIWSYNPIPTGCVLYLPLWHPSLSGPVFKDISTGGHTCTVTDATYGVQGRTFDGANDNIILPLTSSLYPTDFVTYIIWAKETQLDSRSAFMGCEAAGNTGVTLHYFHDNTTMQFTVGSGAVFFSATTTDLPSKTAFTHIAGVNDAVSGTPKVYLYYNGAEKDNSDSTETIAYEGSTPIRIGEKPDGTRDFTGTIGEAYVYNRALSAEEINYHYQHTKWRFQ